MTTDAPEIVIVTTRRVACDGGGGALGHPRVWYEIGEEGYVDCGYCDRRFVLKGGPADTSAAEAAAGETGGAGTGAHG
jgi:uncharacterized Zn-finger protein